MGGECRCCPSIILVPDPEDKQTLGLSQPSSFSHHPQGTTFTRTHSRWALIPFPSSYPPPIKSWL